jgi:hypothetical protein
MTPHLINVRISCEKFLLNPHFYPFLTSSPNSTKPRETAGAVVEFSRLLYRLTSSELNRHYRMAIFGCLIVNDSTNGQDLAKRKGTNL